MKLTSGNEITMIENGEMDPRIIRIGETKFYHDNNVAGLMVLSFVVGGFLGFCARVLYVSYIS